MKTDFTKLKPYKKKNPQVTDPIRYPKVIEVYEKEAKQIFASRINMMVADITTKLVKQKLNGKG
jgi:hypothetical protein